MQSCQQLLILPYHYSFFLIFTISQECDPEDISKIPGILLVEIVQLQMSANDCPYPIPNQPSYLMNYMFHKHDISIISCL